MIVDKGNLSPRPYARLLTMLSEQLIRNKLIALMELVKNSYDADANWVQIRFENFKNFGKKDLKENEKPFIEIEDDGDGMSFTTIKDSWMNPASPNKYYKRKRGKDITKKGRIIQGEKGIGRYAVYKLGYTVEIFTKERNKQSNEIYLKSDLSAYDNELLEQVDRKKSEEPIYIDEISSYYEINDEPKRIVDKEIDIRGEILKREQHGTLIRITNLKHNWKKEDVMKLKDRCKKLVSPFRETDFMISTTYSGEDIEVTEFISLEDILDMALLKIEGEVDKDGFCSYKLDNDEGKLDVLSLTEDSFIKERFYNKNYERERGPECGPFNFKFYVYDMRRGEMSVQPHIHKSRYTIASNRVYLYRDNVRIYPYGDPDDDWLKLDIFRGTKRAGDYLSNDQTIGYITISVRYNPDLKDKTNREGLLEIGNAYEDFRTLIWGLLGYIKKEFDKVKKKKSKKREPLKSSLLLTYSNVKKNFTLLEDHLKTREDSKGLKVKNILEKEYEEERKLFEDRVEIVEDLAGVGIAVDMASHDLMMMMGRSRETLNFLINMADSESLNREKLKDNLDKLYGQFSFIGDQLHGIQPLFRSSRRRSKPYRIKEIIEKVQFYYSVPIEELPIEANIVEKDPPLIIKCPEAILLQLFINLMDNSVYWLKSKRTKSPEIKIEIDGVKCQVIFSDNGPGIASKDMNYIFDAFFTTKGLKGRGLGLYIARQLLERYDYEIEYIVKNKDKILPGANFLINFGESEED
ncbi:MAG: sensor histidine kinase [Candidatus Cloacimonetes bacterium]|nr:sensor histidine kinase [Candidatus Cloacimonadota bacterium]